MIKLDQRSIYPSRWETVGDVEYICYQLPTSDASSFEKCAIMKIDNANGTVYWAEGHQNFTLAWADRATYTYKPLTSKLDD